jgi:hypothetical protein
MTRNEIRILTVMLDLGLMKIRLASASLLCASNCSSVKVTTHPVAFLNFLKVRLFPLTTAHRLKTTGVESTPRRRLNQIRDHPFDGLCLPSPF